MAISINDAIRKIIEDLSVDMYYGKPVPKHVRGLYRLLRKLDMKASFGDELVTMGIPVMQFDGLTKQTK